MRLGYRIAQFGCRIWFLTFCRGRAFDREHVPRAGAVMLVANHQSFLDPVMVANALPRECNYMARDSLFHNRWFGALIRYFNAFPIKRGAADISAIKETLRRLKAGGVVTVFPEGTRTPNGNVQAMQSGSVMIARKARATLVPAMIVGAFEIWPRSQKLPSPGPDIVAYGEPITPEQLAALEDDECIALIRDRIIALMDRYRHHAILSGRGCAKRRANADA